MSNIKLFGDNTDDKPVNNRPHQLPHCCAFFRPTERLGSRWLNYEQLQTFHQAFDIIRPFEQAGIYIQEAHAQTGLSLRYLQQLLKDERLDGFKVGPVWFVYTDSLIAFVDQPRKRGPKGPHKKSHLHDLIE